VAILSQAGRKRPLDQAAAEILAAADLSPRDLLALASESLRRFGQLEALIRTFVPKTRPCTKPAQRSKSPRRPPSFFY
jgi:hypothetical protein